MIRQIASLICGICLIFAVGVMSQAGGWTINETIVVANNTGVGAGLGAIACLIRWGIYGAIGVASGGGAFAVGPLLHTVIGAGLGALTGATATSYSIERTMHWNPGFPLWFLFSMGILGLLFLISAVLPTSPDE